MIIDSHHHFWRYSTADYGWIDDAMAVIRRDFLPVDLQRDIAASDVNGVVSVQARQSLDETRWLLELAAQHSFIRGIVGWVPLIEANIRQQLLKLSRNPKLCAVRHVLQGEPDDFMLRDDFNRGVTALHEFGLRYDILIVERQLPEAIQFVDRHPDQIFILDHIAKPRIKTGEISPWRENLRKLAKRENVYCKISGMVTEADYQSWTVDQLRPYFDAALQAFGPKRLMFGSDWPVCLVACGYGRWKNIVTQMSADLSSDERDRIFGGTATEAYKL